MVGCCWGRGLGEGGRRELGSGLLLRLESVWFREVCWLAMFPFSFFYI